MKKTFLIIVNIFLIAKVCSQATSNITYGLKLGLAVVNTQIDYPNNINTSSSGSTSLIFGGFLNIPLSKKTAFQPTLLFVNKGVRESSQMLNYNYIDQIHYLEIPLIWLHQNPQKIGTYFIGGGLSPAFLIRDEFYNVNKFDLGINLLTGFKFPVGFSVNAAYTHGLLNLSADKQRILKFKNNYLSIAIGYEF